MKSQFISGGCLLQRNSYATLYNGEFSSFGEKAELRRNLADSGRLFGQWDNLGKFSPDAQQFCLSCFLALEDAGICSPEQRHSTGIVMADNYEHENDQKRYFDDYIKGGRQLGRSSFFVHTLPTSAAADASVCLKLSGPLLYWRDDSDALDGLMSAANTFLGDGSAEYMLIGYQIGDEILCIVSQICNGERSKNLHYSAGMVLTALRKRLENSA
ncbi:MAG: hypothetical protein A2020_14990 [Lentisphaerae bacterium GWF2_45_14]|nr:MAG: hypothetical protein A2020_14990 [Lentisphaerae bacterium GWF2_45_14]